MPKFDKQELFKLLGYFTEAAKLDYNYWWIIPRNKRPRFISDFEGVQNALYFYDHIENGLVLEQQSLFINRVRSKPGTIAFLFSFNVKGNQEVMDKNRQGYKKAWKDLIGRMKIACDRSERVENFAGKKVPRYELYRVDLPEVVNPMDGFMVASLELRINLTESDFE